MYSDNDDYDEDITRLIVKPPIKYEIPPMYMSKYRSSIRSSVSSGKSAHKSLGVPKISLNPPTEFLRKYSRTETKRTDIDHKHYRRPEYQHKLPEWQPIRLSKSSNKSTDNPVNTSKDFQKENIEKARISVTKKPQLYPIDDRRGNTWPPKPNSINPATKISTNTTSKITKNFVAKTTKSPEQQRSLKKNLITADKKKFNSKVRENLANRADQSPVDKQKNRGVGKIDAKSREKLADLVDKSSVYSRKIPEKKILKNDKVSLDDLIENKSTRLNNTQRMCHYINEDERAELLYVS